MVVAAFHPPSAPQSPWPRVTQGDAGVSFAVIVATSVTLNQL